MRGAIIAAMRIVALAPAALGFEPRNLVGENERSAARHER